MSFTSPASNQHAPRASSRQTLGPVPRKSHSGWVAPRNNESLAGSITGWLRMLVIFRPENQDILSQHWCQVHQSCSCWIPLCLRGCWAVGVWGCVRIQSTTAVHSRSVGQLLGTNSRGFWLYFGGFETLKIGELA